jgi:hypothetical protein
VTRVPTAEELAGWDKTDPPFGYQWNPTLNRWECYESDAYGWVPVPDPQTPPPDLNDVRQGTRSHPLEAVIQGRRRMRGPQVGAQS